MSPIQELQLLTILIHNTLPTYRQQWQIAITTMIHFHNISNLHKYMFTIEIIYLQNNVLNFIHKVYMVV